VVKYLVQVSLDSKFFNSFIIFLTAFSELFSLSYFLYQYIFLLLC